MQDFVRDNSILAKEVSIRHHSVAILLKVWVRATPYTLILNLRGCQVLHIGSLWWKIGLSRKVVSLNMTLSTHELIKRLWTIRNLLESQYISIGHADGLLEERLSLHIAIAHVAKIILSDTNAPNAVCLHFYNKLPSLM